MKTKGPSERQTDELLPASFTILGPPRTKKNSSWRTSHGHQMPSRAFTAWNESAQLQLIRVARRGTIQRTVNCRARFYRDALRGDAVGYYQALADALQDARVVHDDYLIISWDGSRLDKDAENPRIEVTLEEGRAQVIV